MKLIIIGIAAVILLQLTFKANAGTNTCVSGDTNDPDANKLTAAQ